MQQTVKTNPLNTANKKEKKPKNAYSIITTGEMRKQVTHYAII